MMFRKKYLLGFVAGALLTGVASSAVVSRGTQSVLSAGTKVNAATENTVVDANCQKKYESCMDAFCMIDSYDGGRCVCSADYSEYEERLKQINQLNQDTFELTTLGVKRAETDDILDKTVKNTGVDLSLWNTNYEDTDEIETPDASLPEFQVGTVLFNEANETCRDRIPECSDEFDFMQLLYSQKIKSDCSAFDNSLKQQKQNADERLYQAQRNLRNAAVQEYRDANKYDLGQCMTEFKNCMITTAECGENFESCVAVKPVDLENKDVPLHSIEGSASKIEIYESTYEILSAKKPICDSVTNLCTNVKDQVWDAFLRDVAPQIKTAELNAESDVRTGCVEKISDCFQNACRDSIDPNNPDDSYDMCLTRPESMLSFCKVQLNSCGIDTSSPEKAQESLIWDYVVAKLASMRVDSCTAELKSCLQSEDRCGKDYTQCVGLDTNTIIRMCPYDKLVGCQKVYGEEKLTSDQVYDELASMVQGIMLNIDNNMLDYCQNAVDEAMLKVCGDTENCNSLIIAEGTGANSLDYRICEYVTQPDGSVAIDYTKCKTSVDLISDADLGRLPGAGDVLGPVKPLTCVVGGTIFWEQIGVDGNGMLTGIEQYFDSMPEDDATTQYHKERVESELNTLQRSINSVVQSIESEPIVQFCMTGRRVDGVTDKFDGEYQARFPKLTESLRGTITTYALQQAKNNYYEKYNSLVERMLQDYTMLQERIEKNRDENAKDARRDIARKSCVDLANLSGMPYTAAPSSKIGTILSKVAYVLSGYVVGDPVSVGLLVADNVIDKSGQGQTSIYNKSQGEFVNNQWDYKEIIRTDFDEITLNCHKCTEVTHCEQTKKPVFGKYYCKKWGEPVETCTDIQF